MRWGVIGLGNIAKRFVESLSKHEGSCLYAVASYTKEKREEFFKEYNPEVVYDNYEDLLNDSKVEVVYIALPHKMHKLYTLKALNNFKSVLCEKPAVLFADDLLEIREVAYKNKVFYMEAIKTRFIPLMKDIKEMLESQIIGDIISVKASFNYELGLEGLTKDSYIIDSSQGGALYDIGIYPLNFVVDLLGDDILSVESKMKRFRNYEVDGYFQAVLTYSDGIKGVIEGAIDRNEERIALIEGTKGIMKIPVYYRPEYLICELNDGTLIKKENKIVGDDFYGQIEEVYQCIRQSKIESERLMIEQSYKMISIIEEIKRKAIME